MWNIRTFTELPSTQALARELFSSGKAEHGDVFIAQHQTEGRGRYNDRIWYDEPGANLLMSIVLTDIPPDIQNLMQFSASVCARGAIIAAMDDRFDDDYDMKRIRLKWPNDILLDGKKIAGVLADAVWSGTTFKGVIVGLGINVNQLRFPDEFIDISTSLKKVTGKDCELPFLRNFILLLLEMNLQKSRKSLMEIIRNDISWMHELQNFSLTEPNGTKVVGLRYDGITDDGALQVITSDGSKQTYQNASLHLV